MLRYAISDRMLYPGDERARQLRVVQQAAALALEGVDYFQLREKDLDEASLLQLTVKVRDAVQSSGARMQVVLNGPQHLAVQAGVAWHRSSTHSFDQACCSVSVHTLDDVEQQRAHASLLLFAPVFGKTVGPDLVHTGVGLERLRGAVERAAGTPVLALGGVTPQNAPLCLAAGASGIAGIRLFLR
ncbi:thiamine phosphate synthase [Terriglobus aquaticus]|uniref:Thiamine phosphate synthase n=1 Tax=Terriglobus aquaticus TaxID=940139 RepID=A0ABW9KMV7_9BACT|nr:thiamine phosphate synthase [Terriglobus aquaticus]